MLWKWQRKVARATRNWYGNLSKEVKDRKKREYGGNRCENMSEEDKPKLKGCGKTVLIEKIA